MTNTEALPSPAGDFFVGDASHSSRETNRVAYSATPGLDEKSFYYDSIVFLGENSQFLPDGVGAVLQTAMSDTGELVGFDDPTAARMCSLIFDARGTANAPFLWQLTIASYEGRTITQLETAIAHTSGRRVIMDAQGRQQSVAALAPNEVNHETNGIRDLLTGATFIAQNNKVLRDKESAEAELAHFIIEGGRKLGTAKRKNELERREKRLKNAGYVALQSYSIREP